MMAQKGSDGSFVPGVKESEAGDICVYDVNKESLAIIKAAEWSASKYPIATYIPIGVVAVPASHNHYSDGKCAIMSLNHMNCLSPTTGGVAQDMCWGNNTNIKDLPDLNKVPYVGSNGSVGDKIIGVAAKAYLPSDYSDFTAVTNPYDKGTKYKYSGGNRDYIYIPSPYNNDGTFNTNYSLTTSPSSTSNCLSDFDGKGNTQKILEVRGAKDYGSWAPSRGANADYPAASCCDMYSTVGIPQGCWYLPAAGELGYVCVRRQALDNSLDKLIQGGVSSANVLVSYKLWSSSEYSFNYARYVDLNIGIVGDSHYKYHDCYVRAFGLV